MAKPNFISRAVEAVRKPPAVKERTVKHPFDEYRDPDFEPGPADGVTVRHYGELDSARIGRAPLTDAQKAGVQAQAQLAAERRLQRLRESL